MEEPITYTITGEYNGLERTMTVINESETVYKVYWDEEYVGTMWPECDDDLGIVWMADTPRLLSFSQELGECIERADI